MSRFDIVVFGATGYTGKWVIRQIVGSKLFEGLTWAVAGRSESKLRQVLDELSQITGKNLRAATIIVADVSDVQSLNDMAAQARVIINTVGPYQLYGEPVVKAAVENGASHVDISGEQPFIERMVLKYGLQASEKGLYIVSACGWDSIPADLGVAYLKDHFEGDLNHIESYAAFHKGPAGYALNTGTYESIIGMVEDTVGGRVKNNDRALMPLKTPKSKYKAPFRFPFRFVDEPEIGGIALPFPGVDATIVRRSQYYDYVQNNQRPVTLNTYFRTESVFWTALLVLWLPFFLVLAAIPPTRKLLKDYPDWLTFGLFKKSGPTEEQVSQSHWTTFHVGYGWTDKLPAISTHPTPPNKKVILKVHGPDAAYVGTSGFLVSTALAILKKKNLPSGGVHTTGSAFGKTDIYKYLETFGITFEIIKSTAI